MPTYTVRIKLGTLNDARTWFEDVRAAGLAPDAGLRHLELDDTPTDLADEVPLIIAGATSSRPRMWVVEPEHVYSPDSGPELAA